VLEGSGSEVGVHHMTGLERGQSAQFLQETNNDERMYLFVKVTYPLSKLCCIRNGGREEYIVDVIRQQDDCLFPNHSPLWTHTYCPFPFLNRHEGNIARQLFLNHCNR